MHTSHAAETHYFPLANAHKRRTLIHTHLDAPFIDQARHFPSYVNLTIISSAEPECQQGLSNFRIALDWPATFGRWASRYLHTLVSWAAGVASMIMFFAWAPQDAGGTSSLLLLLQRCSKRFFFQLQCLLLINL
jgi:glycosylphosphatidylinositol deacylase